LRRPLANGRAIAQSAADSRRSVRPDITRWHPSIAALAPRRLGPSSTTPICTTESPPAPRKDERRTKKSATKISRFHQRICLYKRVWILYGRNLASPHCRKMSGLLFVASLTRCVTHQQVAVHINKAKASLCKEQSYAPRGRRRCSWSRRPARRPTTSCRATAELRAAGRRTATPLTASATSAAIKANRMCWGSGSGPTAHLRTAPLRTNPASTVRKAIAIASPAGPGIPSRRSSSCPRPG
jgi:hypothetical protein